MFELLRYVCELIFGSSLALSRESFEYLSVHLHNIIVQLIQQAFTIALRAKRTQLLGDDLQIVLKCRNIPPLFGYCHSSTTNRASSFKSVYQGARTLFYQNDTIINFSEIQSITTNTLRDKILLDVEWLAIEGEQKLPPIKLSYFNNSILKVEQQLYLSFLQSKNFNEEIQNALSNDQIALNTILPQLIDWYRNNICECLIHSCRLEKRRHLAYYLTMINYLLQNSATVIDHYLYIISPIILTCFLYEYEVDDPSDFNVNNDESVINTGHIWSLRILSAQACIKILRRSNFLIYDTFTVRIFSRLIYSLTLSSTPSSLIYAILYLFERLGCRVCRTFLLPYLVDIDSVKVFSSKAILSILERIALLTTIK
ncbi:unnamed protein product [Adineta ricciae]|uniref:TAF6 C-terminal HEAT repeat domain-containing protein n=1 Tax=Adineta ricciae TaxID=249248 RepID=A0A814QN83_ADIRI|nr:unnamed protein product [Adineta ricciae]CAF1122598.1 unnamed protein product [Adineta ricciae]